MDDVSGGDNTVERCFELYKRTVNCFYSGGFLLHKWASNSQELMELIEANESSGQTEETTKLGSLENDQSFAKLSIEGAEQLDSNSDGGKLTKVLGILWDRKSDEFIFDLNSLAEFGRSLRPTKRNLLCLTAKLFDPTGLLSPIVFLLKVLFQATCVCNYKWDDELTGEHLRI